MRDIERQLLSCLAAYRTGRNAAVEAELSGEGRWQQLYDLAVEHKLEHVVCETLWRDSAFCRNERQLAGMWQRKTVLHAAVQAGKTQKLLRLGSRLQEQGIPYAVLKGVICRALYTRPELRPSGDEDVLIFPEDFRRCSELLQQEGFAHIRQGAGEEDVTHWMDAQTGLHIELHTKLFSTKREGEAQLNDCLSRQLRHPVVFQTEGGAVQTLAPTWHFLFLIAHALKHFIYGGFGIRTLCDVVTYEEKYREEIDREEIASWLDRLSGRVFFEQMLVIAKKYLDYDLAGSGWEIAGGTDCGDMLEDILAAGVYGQTTMDRRHSNNLVLHAAEEGTSRSGLLRTLFPPRSKLMHRYPVLERQPALLPVMWLRRLGSYGWEVVSSAGKGNSPLGSVVLGKKRIKLLSKYGVIRKDKPEDK